MATGFSVDEGKCEGPGCQAASGVTYYVTEKKCLCEKCASKTGCIKKGRKGEIGLACEIHDMPVKLYCQDHELAVCQICAIKDHIQKPCKLEDIPVVLEQKRDQLLKLRPAFIDKQTSWKVYTSKVIECRKECETHFESVRKVVNDTKENKMALTRKKEQEAAKRINDQADEEIRKKTEEINEKREARLKQCHEEAETRRHRIEKKQRELLDDVTLRSNKTENRIEDLNPNPRDVMQAIDRAAERMEILLEDDKELLKGAHELITQLDDTLGKTADEDFVKNISFTVEAYKEYAFGRLHHESDTFPTVFQQLYLQSLQCNWFSTGKELNDMYSRKW